MLRYHKREKEQREREAQNKGFTGQIWNKKGPIFCGFLNVGALMITNRLCYEDLLRRSWQYPLGFVIGWTIIYPIAHAIPHYRDVVDYFEKREKQVPVIFNWSRDDSETPGLILPQLLPPNRPNTTK